MFSDLCVNPYLFSSSSPEHKTYSALLDLYFNSEHVVGSKSLSSRDCKTFLPWTQKKKGMAELYEPDTFDLHT